MSDEKPIHTQTEEDRIWRKHAAEEAIVCFEAEKARIDRMIADCKKVIRICELEEEICNIKQTLFGKTTAGDPHSLMVRLASVTKELNHEKEAANHD